MKVESAKNIQDLSCLLQPTIPTADFFTISRGFERAISRRCADPTQSRKRSWSSHWRNTSPSWNTSRSRWNQCRSALAVLSSTHGHPRNQARSHCGDGRRLKAQLVPVVITPGAGKWVQAANVWHKVTWSSQAIRRSCTTPMQTSWTSRCLILTCQRFHVPADQKVLGGQLVQLFTSREIANRVHGFGGRAAALEERPVSIATYALEVPCRRRSDRIANSLRRYEWRRYHAHHRHLIDAEVAGCLSARNIL